jgi:hypothetical protein
MNAKRATGVIGFLGMVAANSLTPAPVCAQDTLEITGIVTGAYAAAVLIGGEIYRRSKGSLDFAPAPSGDFRPNLASVARRPQASGVRLGPQCRQTSRGPTLLCW